jgi:hypothetical protein
MGITVCLTSISPNIDILHPTLRSLVEQSLKPDRIVLYLSEEPYLLDKGFPGRKVPAFPPVVEVRWTKNTGPFRKLLPLLREYWGKDEIIITVDDDTVYHSELVEKMVTAYKETGCCIGCRCIYVGDPRTSEYVTTAARERDVYNFHTGKGAVLYHPSMFKHEGILSEDYLLFCPTGDDHWFNMWRMHLGTECLALNFKYMTRDLTKRSTALYHNFNEKANKLTFRRTADFIFSR